MTAFLVFIVTSSLWLLVFHMRITSIRIDHKNELISVRNRAYDVGFSDGYEERSLVALRANKPTPEEI